MIYLNQLQYEDLAYPTTLELGETLQEPYPSVAVAGCGLCCMAMILSMLHERAWSVEEMMTCSIAAGANVYGTDLKKLSRYFEKKNLCRAQMTDDPQQLFLHLEKGNPAILHVAKTPGLFSDAGHYVVAAFFRAGKVFLMDPSATEEKYDRPDRKKLCRLEGEYVVTTREVIRDQLGNRHPGCYLFSKV